MAAERPIYSFDLDGVLASPPFNWNPAINRDTSLQPRPDGPPPVPRPHGPGPLDRALTRSWYELRYAGRALRPGALDAVRAAAELGEVIVLTGRRERGRRRTRDWLERAGIWPHLSELVMNATPFGSARYKEVEARRRNIIWHADDDAATCALLARCGVEVALLDWPRNRGLPYPDGVERRPDMHAVAADLRGRAR